MLTYYQTSILTSSAQTVVNTVNTVGVMGKGIAAEFKKRHPEMFVAYRKLCEQKQLDVGMLWLWRGSDQWVLNFPTKKHWRNPSKLEYIEAGLKKFVREYERQAITEISFPRLGCGNGGLDWENVRPLMESYLADLPIQVNVHDFVVNIGRPEHHQAELEPAGLSFPKFIADLREQTARSKGEIATLHEGIVCHAKWIDSSAIILSTAEKDVHVTVEELFSVWDVLQRGPLSAAHITGEAAKCSDCIIGMLASLDYVRLVQLSSLNGKSYVAVELCNAKIQEQGVASWSANPQEGLFE